MAEGVVVKTEQGQTLNSGSEFVFDFYCELCRDDGLNIEAGGFCVDCNEYLCKTCFHAHRRSRPARHHDLLDQDSMPRDTPLSQDRVCKDISTKCKIHRGKTVEFFCAPHDTLGCSTCFMALHRNCADIESVYEKSENILNSQEYNVFVRSLKEMEQKLRDMTAKARTNVATTAKSCFYAIKDLRRLREEFIAIFDELGRNLITQINAITSEDTENMKCLEKELSEFSKAVENLKSKVDGLVNSKCVCQLYIYMKEKKNEISSLEVNLRKAKGSIDVRRFEFVPNNDIKNVLKATGVGKIVLSNRQDRETDTVVVDDNRDINDPAAMHISEIGIISIRTDRRKNYPTGSAVLSDTRMVIADFSNQSVKLLDTCAGKLISSLKVQEWPFDIARINDNQAALSLCYSNKILMLKVTDKLSIDRKISIRDECRGVTYSQNKLLVTFPNIPRLEIMDLQGKLIKRIEYNSDGKKIFSEPRHVCVSNNRENIYVSDTGAQKVFCLSFDGTVKSVYSGLSDPQKVCTDQRGHVYVAGSDTRTIHMLTADCTKIKEILTQADGLDKRVLSVSYCQGTSRLYVGMDEIKSVKVHLLSESSSVMKD